MNTRDTANTAIIPITSTTQAWREFFLQQPFDNLIWDIRALRAELRAWRENRYTDAYYPASARMQGGYDWCLAARLCALARMELHRRHNASQPAYAALAARLASIDDASFVSVAPSPRPVGKHPALGAGYGRGGSHA